jgi:hypothetical protein
VSDLCYNQFFMGSTIQARLDEESRKTLATLVKQLGWSPSKVVREGLRLLAACRLRKSRRAIIGMAKFDSGIRNLGSNKEHLKGFGR